MAERPFGVFVRAKNRPSDRGARDLEAEIVEEMRDRARIERRAMRKPDPVGEMLGCTHFVENKRFAATYMGSPVTVTRFYPQKNIAVDVFESLGRAEKREVAFKRSVFKKSGVSYAALNPFVDDLGDLLKQIGAN